MSMRSNSSSNYYSKEDDRNKDASSSPSTLDSRFNQTLRNVQGLLKGRSFPGKVLITQRSDPLDQSALQSPNNDRRFSNSDTEHREQFDTSVEDEIQNRSNANASSSTVKMKASTASTENTSKEVQKTAMGARSTDSARLMKFKKELSGTTVILEKLRELAWSGVPPYLRPTVWRLLLGYAPSNSDRREGVLKRKRLEYLDCVAQNYDIPDIERTDEEINMLRQIAVDCPRTVPDVSFFQQAEVQKSLERILYTWAIRHPASEYLSGSIDTWSMADLSPEKISNVEADCYWCLSKLLDGMQVNYTFAQPGIQRLVFKLKELVRRIDEPVSTHMEEQGLEFLQFAFSLEGDALPDFLVYIFASFLLTWSDKLQKLEFQDMVMFLQHLPTRNWNEMDLEMVLSRAYMWHTMFNKSPSHLAG
ncbi:Ypt/Rab-GAP domain of gyp1p superfamily protein [Abeliophyllum distichum]|uniref:Ypt/Rab-GAP domain of gyp1p superfamily protein n=1 Tax=Abeliophyllum distichum TaxID=126358 RepID=A0ABD1T0H1_9LAMI